MITNKEANLVTVQEFCLWLDQRDTDEVRSKKELIPVAMTLSVEEVFGGYIEVVGDNSCFFNAITQWWFLNISSHKQKQLSFATQRIMSRMLRNRVVRTIMSTPNLPITEGDTLEDLLKKENTTIQQYAKFISDDNEWAGRIEVFVIGYMLSVPTVVYQLNPDGVHIEARMSSKLSEQKRIVNEQNVSTIPPLCLYMNGWAGNVSSHYSLLTTNSVFASLVTKKVS